MHSRAITVVTSTRFHLVDLARELLALGHDLRLLSYLPHAHVERLGVPRARHVSLLPHLAPLVALLRLPFAPRMKRALSERLLLLTDRLVARRLVACDAVIGLSGLAVATSIRAKALGAKALVDSGSAHVAAALRALGRSEVSAFYERRERLAYAGADRLVVGSGYAARTFMEQGIDPGTLFVNPYGVDLASFPPTTRTAGRPTLLHVGNWSRRKGCDLLVDAWARLPGVDLLHVGPVIDLELPRRPGFLHQDPVPQERLREYYAGADILVLPSRDDGYGMVLNQGAACGLQIVASDSCGAPDLARLLGEPKAVRLFPSGSVPALLAALEACIACIPHSCTSPVRDWLGTARERLGWRAYGIRYASYIEGLFHGA